MIQAATPVAVQRQGIPAKRVFQALRIEVNEELSVLERAMPAALDTLAVGGRIVVLAYQSLEDRIVKRVLQARVELDGARRAADGAARAPPAVQAPRAGRRAGERDRAGREPARETGAPARRRTSEEAVMSALPAQSVPAPTGARRRAPALLRPAPEAARRAKPRLAYAIIAVGGRRVIIVAQMLLSIAVTQGAYEVDAFQIAQAKLARQEQQLREDLDRVQSPQYLAANAEALGMVPNANPVYLRLSDGAVLGEPAAADGGAGSTAPLVPNALIDGVPLVTEQQTGETPSRGTRRVRPAARPRPSRPCAGTAARRRRAADPRDALTTENEHEPTARNRADEPNQPAPDAADPRSPPS